MPVEPPTGIFLMLPLASPWEGSRSGKKLTFIEQWKQELHGLYEHLRRKAIAADDIASGQGHRECAGCSIDMRYWIHRADGLRNPITKIPFEFTTEMNLLHGCPWSSLPE